MQPRWTGENSSGIGTKEAPAPSSGQVGTIGGVFCFIHGAGPLCGSADIRCLFGGTAPSKLLMQGNRGCGRGATGREGYVNLNFQDERDGRKRRKPDSDSESSVTPRTRKKREPAGEVGTALRSAYQRMVDEEIPPDLLDLLGKLG